MSVLGGLYRGESAVDFPSLWRRAVIVSTVAVLVGLASFGVRGLNLGLDFEGGTSFEVRSPGTSVAEARQVMERLDAGDARIQIVDGEVLLIRPPPRSTPFPSTPVFRCRARVEPRGFSIWWRMC